MSPGKDRTPRLDGHSVLKVEEEVNSGGVMGVELRFYCHCEAQPYRARDPLFLDPKQIPRR